MEAHNAFAGQGAVVLDIGGDVGALIVELPATLSGVEIEIRPVGAQIGHAHSYHDPSHSHDHEHHHPHVAVVARPIDGANVPSAVFADLHEGEYELYERTVGVVRLRACVRGGEVTVASWPT